MYFSNGNGQYNIIVTDSYDGQNDKNKPQAVKKICVNVNNNSNNNHEKESYPLHHSAP